MRHWIIFIIAILSTQIGATQSIQGIVFDKETGEPLPFANVILFEDSIQRGGVTTSLDGEYSFEGIAPGTYNIEAVYVGYPNHRISAVKVVKDNVKVDIRMEENENGVDLSEIGVIRNLNIKLFRSDGTPNYVTIYGKVFDEKTEEGLPFANVILLQKGVQIAGTTTNHEGNYIFGKIEQGEYGVEVVYVGYPNVRITGILVEENRISLDIVMKKGDGCHFEPVFIRNLNIPFFNWETTPTTGATWKASDIKRFPGF